MDIIPSPLRSSLRHPPIVVPLCIRSLQYTFPDDLFEFPDKPPASVADAPIATPAELAAYIQSWLFFGLLAFYNGSTPDVAEYSKERFANGQTTKYISMEAIATQAWGFSISGQATARRNSASSGHSQSSDDSWQSSDSIYIRNLKQIVQKVEDSLNLLEYHPSAPCSPVPEVILSVRLLLDITSAALGLRCRPMQDFANRQVIQDARPALQILLDRLYANGWCPSKVAYLCTQYHFVHIAYLSHIDREIEQHPRKISHERCNNGKCVAGNMEDSKLCQPLHVRKGCHCRPLFSNLDKVKAILSKGKVPLIRLSTTDEGDVELDVVPATAQSRYIALSHIWSDGLGNPHDNSVHTCQLLRIKQQLATLPEHSEGFWGAISTSKLNIDLHRRSVRFGPRPKTEAQLFWLDVLCIPVKADDTTDDATYKKLRRNAISQIPLIFAGAAHVLILDIEAQKLRLGASQMAEVVAHFIGCNWGTRAWTYTEGAHSYKCSVQLADGSFDPRDTKLKKRSWKGFVYTTDRGLPWIDMSEDKDDHFSRTLHERLEELLFKDFLSELRNWFPKVKDSNRDHRPSKYSLRLQTYSPSDTFVKTWNELLSRSSTRQDDRLTIFAMALGLPLRDIIQLPNDQKLKSILYSLEEIPMSLLFIPQDTINPSTDVLDRWIPDLLAESTSAASHKLDYLGSEFEFSPDKTHLELTIISERCKFVAIPVPTDEKFEARLDDRNLVVRFLRPRGDVLDRSKYRRAVLIYNPDACARSQGEDHFEWIAGCCLLVSNIEQRDYLDVDGDYIRDETVYNVVYDCAVAIAIEPLSQIASEVTESSKESPTAVTTTASQCHDLPKWTLLKMPCNPPPLLISRPQRQYLLSGNSWFALAMPSGFLATFSLAIALIAAIISSKTTPWSSLTPLGKATAYVFYSVWVIGIGMLVVIMFLLFIVGLLWIHPSARLAVKNWWKRGNEMRVSMVLIGWAVLYGLWTVVGPFVALVLSLVDHHRSGGGRDRRPYKTVDSVFVVFLGIYCLFPLAYVVVGVVWGPMARRLWIAGFAPDTLCVSDRGSVLKVGTWKQALRSSDPVANVLFVLRADKVISGMWNFVDDQGS